MGNPFRNLNFPSGNSLPQNGMMRFLPGEYTEGVRGLSQRHSQFLADLSSRSLGPTRELREQLDRASLSALANIAEGNGRRQRRQRAKFFDDARGSGHRMRSLPGCFAGKRICLFGSNSSRRKISPLFGEKLHHRLQSCLAFAQAITWSKKRVRVFSVVFVPWPRLHRAPITLANELLVIRIH